MSTDEPDLGLAEVAVRTDLGAEERAHRARLLDQLRFEIVPMKSISRAIDELPEGLDVSVTCSPAKGVDATLDITEELIGVGHEAIPHLAARMVRSPAHLHEIVDRLNRAEIHEVFVIAGDAPDPTGPFFDSVQLLEALLEIGTNLTHVGYGAYPDSHPLIDAGALHEALHLKQRMLDEAGVAGHVSTQMCFSPDTIRAWLLAERAAGLHLPVHLGVAGVLDRAKLLTMGVRLGVGTSLRFLKKNRSAIGSLLSAADYDPDQLIDPLSVDLAPLGVEAVHAFTFNQVARTESWRRTSLARLGV